MYKIASLLPSATEICCALGLKDNLVAVSHECDFPEGLQQIPRITSSIIPPNLDQKEIDVFVKQAMKKGLSLYSVDEEKLNSLQPDIIVTQGLCSVCAVSETTIEAALRGNVCHLPIHTKVISFSGVSFDGICSDIRLLAKETNKETEAEVYISNEKQKWNSISKEGNESLLLLEWIDPYFSAGHWVPEQISKAGFQSSIGTSNEVSRGLSSEEIAQSQASGIGVICCGFNLEQNIQFAQKLYDDPALEHLEAIRTRNVWAFDANSYFSRPTLRIRKGAELLHLAFSEHTEVPSCSKRVGPL